MSKPITLHSLPLHLVRPHCRAIGRVIFEAPGHHSGGILLLLAGNSMFTVMAASITSYFFAYWFGVLTSEIALVWCVRWRWAFEPTTWGCWCLMNNVGMGIDGLHVGQGWLLRISEDEAVSTSSCV